MYWAEDEVTQTLRMIESENLDIRTVTMGISLRDTASRDVNQTAELIYNKITNYGSRLLSCATEVEEEFAIPIVNKRVAVTPVAIVAESCLTDDYTPIGLALDKAAKDIKVDYIGGFSALVHKGFTPGDLKLIHSIAEVLPITERVCASVNLASTLAGINMDAVRIMGEVIKRVANKTADRGSIGCARLVCFANMPEDNPFIAGANHGVGESECVINVGVSGPGVVLSAINRMKKYNPDFTFSDLVGVIKRMAFKITRAGELIGREVARRLGAPVRFGIVDLSLAPTPAVGDSVANILEAMGLESVGIPGTTAALSLLTDAVKKGGAMASSHIGGLSGAFIPVSEDGGMIEAVKNKSLSLEKLEAMTAVCSVGLDMVAIPGDTPATTVSAILADEISIGVVNNKTTAVRIIPIIGKSVGQSVDYGGLLGEAPVMAVSQKDCSPFINIKGRIPAPLTSMRN